LNNIFIEPNYLIWLSKGSKDNW